jgi:putative tryptophan/tyrosine transport system permease protein
MLKLFFIIFEQVFLYFPLVLGTYISISLMKIPDLSIEVAYVFGAIFASKIIYLDFNVSPFLLFFFVLFSSMIGGSIVGLISATLCHIANIPHLLSSILTIGLFHGINQFVLGGAIISVSQYNNCLEQIPFIESNPEFLMLGIIFIMVAFFSFLFLKTQIGFCLAVFGVNQSFFEYYKISRTFVYFLGICIANSLAGISGYFVMQTSGFVDVNAGVGMILFAITSLILGKSLYLKKKYFSFSIPIIGVISYCVIQQILLKFGFNLKYFTMIQSTIVLVILVKQFYKVN